MASHVDRSYYGLYQAVDSVVRFFFKCRIFTIFCLNGPCMTVIYKCMADLFCQMSLGVSVDELLYDRSVKSSGNQWQLEDGRTLHILHFNDVYNLDPSVTEEPIGGAARFATLMDYVQRDLLTTYGCHPLILFSGDFVGPSLMSITSKGAHIIEMLNLLGVHCATFGNHELDYGYDNLLDLLRGSNTHPASNVQWI